MHIDKFLFFCVQEKLHKGSKRVQTILVNLHKNEPKTNVRKSQKAHFAYGKMSFLAFYYLSTSHR